MASNRLPDQRESLFNLGDVMCIGLHTHEIPLGVKQTTEAVLHPAVVAARATDAAFGTAKVAKKTANAVVTAADTAIKVLITNARKRLSRFFGESYVAEWGEAGWPDNSVAMPSTQDARLALVKKLNIYLTGHPAHESEDMDVTAALAESTSAAMDAAVGAQKQKVTDAGNAKDARDAAERNLRKRMTGLITELATLLSEVDQRWHAFGLSRPADEDTSEVPSFTTAIPGSLPGTGLVDWDDALRAEHYRVWILIVGTDTEFHAVDSPSDSDATLASLPTGSTVKVRVTSVNDAGESAPGPEAQFVVP